MLTVKEATEKYGVSATTLRRWIKEKLLPHSYEVIDFKRVLVIDEEQLRSFLISRFGDVQSKKKSSKTRGVTELHMVELKNLLVAVEKLLAKLS